MSVLLLYVHRGVKVITFATSAFFEIIALKTAGQVEGEFWLDLASQASPSS